VEEGERRGKGKRETERGERERKREDSAEKNCRSMCPRQPSFKGPRPPLSPSLAFRHSTPLHSHFYFDSDEILLFGRVLKNESSNREINLSLEYQPKLSFE
jgi:hypothetical protein